MKKHLAVATIITLSVIAPVWASAETTTTDDTTSAVIAGQQVWDRLSAKQITCSGLNESNFETLGEYFMDQMMGTAHENMNQLLIARLGQSGEEQMHIAMGKRLSGCDPQAAYPAGVTGFMPMMGGSYGGWSGAYPMMGYGGMMGGFGYGAYPGSMMSWGGYGGYSWFSWITTALIWILLAVGILAAVKWLRKK